MGQALLLRVVVTMITLRLAAGHGHSGDVGGNSDKRQRQRRDTVIRRQAHLLSPSRALASMSRKTLLSGGPCGPVDPIMDLVATRARSAARQRSSCRPERAFFLEHHQATSYSRYGSQKTESKLRWSCLWAAGLRGLLESWCL